MTLQNFKNSVEFLMLAKPFRPYTIVLNDGKELQVDYPLAVLLSLETGRTIVNGPGGQLHVFDASSVTRLMDDIDNRPLDPAEMAAAEV